MPGGIGLRPHWRVKDGVLFSFGVILRVRVVSLLGCVGCGPHCGSALCGVMKGCEEVGGNLVGVDSMNSNQTSSALLFADSLSS